MYSNMAVSSSANPPMTYVYTIACVFVLKFLADEEHEYRYSITGIYLDHFS